jgi:hypothetical protein
VGLRLPSDDWRQIEFIGLDRTAIVESECLAIRHQGNDTTKEGFANLYKRRLLAHPLDASHLSVEAMGSSLVAAWLGGLWVEDETGEADFVSGSRVFRCPGGLLGYCVERDGSVMTLGLADARGLFAFKNHDAAAVDLGPDAARVMTLVRDFRLLLVDWCAATIIRGGT